MGEDDVSVKLAKLETKVDYLIKQIEKLDDMPSVAASAMQKANELEKRMDRTTMFVNGLIIAVIAQVVGFLFFLIK